MYKYAGIMGKRKETGGAAGAAAVLKQLGEFCLSAADTLATRPDTVDEGWLKRTAWEVWNRQEAACDELVALLSKKEKGRVL